MSKETATSYGLCLGIDEDDFLEDKALWVVDLESGFKVYQDDHRNDVDEPIAWKRLFKYCKEQEDNIQAMYIKFRSHIVHLPRQQDCDGYYFSYGAIREINDAITQMHYVCGTYSSSSESVFCNWYKTPELIHTKTDIKKYDPEYIEKKTLILKVKS